MSGYVVKYKVAGFEGERTTEVYPSQDVAWAHADDIKGFEGVEYAFVVEQSSQGAEQKRA